MPMHQNRQLDNTQDKRSTYGSTGPLVTNSFSIRLVKLIYNGWWLIPTASLCPPLFNPLVEMPSLLFKTISSDTVSNEQNENPDII